MPTLGAGSSARVSSTECGEPVVQWGIVAYRHLRGDLVPGRLVASALRLEVLARPGERHPSQFRVEIGRLPSRLGDVPGVNDQFGDVLADRPRRRELADGQPLRPVQRARLAPCRQQGVRRRAVRTDLRVYASRGGDISEAGSAGFDVDPGRAAAKHGVIPPA